MIINVMITRKDNTAVKCVKVGGATKTFTSNTNSTFESTLECIIDTLKVIPTNEEATDKMYNIYLPDALIGFAYGSVNSYIKNGCTNSGGKLTSKEIELFKQALVMYGQRILNITFKAIKQINSKDAALIGLKKYCIEALNSAIKEQSTNNTTVVNSDPNAVLRQQLSDQMLKLVQEGKIAEAQAVVAMITNLSSTASTPEVQQEVATEVEKVVDVDNTSEEDIDAMMQRDALELGITQQEIKVNDFTNVDVEADGIAF